MTTRLISAATVVMAFALLIAGNAWAQASENNPCAGLTGKAKGLCTAYSKGMGCSSDSPGAGERACANVATMFEEVTGSPPPSDCACDFSLERTRDEIERFTHTIYGCFESNEFDPNDLTGVSSTTLQNHEIGVLSDDIVRALIFPSGGGMKSLCSYRTAGIEYQKKEEITFDLGMVIQKVREYEACRGAIRTLAANVDLVNECNF